MTRRPQDGRGAGDADAGAGVTAQGLVVGMLRQRRELVVLVIWALVGALPTFVMGHALARALDKGFLAGKPGVGLAWLGALACAIPVGAWGTRMTYLGVAKLVEPLRDDLVRLVVDGALRRSTDPGAPRDTAAVARLTQHVESVRDNVAGLFLLLLSFVAGLVAALSGLVSLAPVVLPLVLVPLVVSFAAFAASLPAVTRQQRRLLMADERLAELAADTTEGLRDVVACGGEDRVTAALHDRVDEQVAAGKAVARVSATRTIIMAVGGRLPLVLVLLSAGWLIDRGLTAGELLGALTYLIQGLEPAVSSVVGSIGAPMAQLVQTLRRIDDALPEASTGTSHPGTASPDTPANATQPGATPGTAPLDTPPSVGSAGTPAGMGSPGTVPVGAAHLAGVGNGSPPQDVDPRRGVATAPHDLSATTTEATPRYDVVVQRVDFRYRAAAEPVLRDLDLEVPEGDHLAIVGPSGAGKSTLAAMVVGLLAPQSGRVLLGGRPATEVPAHERVLIPQQAYAFRGTLEENLRYLHDEAPASALDEAIDAVGMGELVSRLGGLRAELEPSALSAGERQLVSLVRAYLSPAQLVVLDEATCHLDPTAEAVAEQAFAARGGTLIVVAHRISSARRARRILVMDGEATVVGTHDELVERSLLYRDLVGHWFDHDPGTLDQLSYRP